jgi:hypothetical protein
MGYTFDTRKPILELGKVDETVIEHLRELDYGKIVKSSYAPNRLETWFGWRSNLQSIKEGRMSLQWEKDFPEWLLKLKGGYFPDSNSALICKGHKPESETSIDWHRDHGSFENRVVMINFGFSIFYVQDYYNGTVISTLRDREVVDFDSKLLHKSTQISDERYIITFRKARKEFTNHKLF